MKVKQAAWRVLYTVALASVMTFGGMQAQTARHRIGATCNDGTASTATGSGAKQPLITTGPSATPARSSIANAVSTTSLIGVSSARVTSIT